MKNSKPTSKQSKVTQEQTPEETMFYFNFFADHEQVRASVNDMHMLISLCFYPEKYSSTIKTWIKQHTQPL